MKKSSAFLVVILLMVMSILTACGGTQSGGLSRVKEQGRLKVGIDASYPPMEFVDSDGKTPIGFDIDLAEAVAQKLGVKADFTIIDWDGIQAGLLGGHYDVIISSMTITEDRQKDLNFVEYIRMGIAYVSREGIDVKTEKDLDGLVVAVQTETTAQFFLEELPDVKMKALKSFPFATDAFREVENQQADVVVIDEPVAGYYAKLDPGRFRVTGTATLEPDPIGIALKKQDTELMKAIEKAVAELKADGTIKRLSEKWFGRELGQ